MQKKITMALTILIVSMSTFAEAAPMGTAASKAAIYSPSAWKIEKVQNGRVILDNARWPDDWNHRDDGLPIFRITNVSSVASKYYIKTMDAVNVDDNSLTIPISPKIRNGLFGMKIEDHVWGFFELGTNSSQDIAVTTSGEFSIKPGRYTAYLQLIVPSP